MASVPTHRGLGVTAGLDAGVARELAAQCEQLGYHSLWSNDEPAARGLDTLSEFAATTARVQLGVGVLPLHRYQPAQIAAEVEHLGIDPARLWLGIGSGALPLQIDALTPGGGRASRASARGDPHRRGRDAASTVPPRGAVADGVLLNWMLPGQAARARGWVHEGAAEKGRPHPRRCVLRAGVALGRRANQRLREEEGFYRAINEGHRKHFAAMDVAVGSVGIAGVGAVRPP